MYAKRREEPWSSRSLPWQSFLNMTVVAEGVENKEELEVLKELKCDEVQGFYYARPMPEDEFVQYVNEN